MRGVLRMGILSPQRTENPHFAAWIQIKRPLSGKKPKAQRPLPAHALLSRNRVPRVWPRGCSRARVAGPHVCRAGLGLGSSWARASQSPPRPPRPQSLPGHPSPHPRPTTYPKRVGAISAAEAAQRHAGGRLSEEPQRRAVGPRHRDAAPPRPAPRVGASEATRCPGLGL